LGTNALHGDVKRFQYASSKPLLLTEESQQDVLGTDVVVLEDAGFLLGQDDHLAGAFCEALKHGFFLASGTSEGGDDKFALYAVSARSPDGVRTLGSPLL
jgi:hypothetical protein